jgi:LPS-assembly lipoprotein
MNPFCSPHPSGPKGNDGLSGRRVSGLRALQRGLVLLLPVCLLLGACGFEWRGSRHAASQLGFDTLYVQGASQDGVFRDFHVLLSRQGIEVHTGMPPAAGEQDTEKTAVKATQGSTSVPRALVLVMTDEGFERQIVGTNPAGGVREVELKLHLTFHVRSLQGRECLPPTRLVQRTPLAYNEGVALAKEEEQNQLIQMMRGELAVQLAWRLARVWPVGAAHPACLAKTSP